VGLSLSTIAAGRFVGYAGLALLVRILTPRVFSCPGQPSARFLELLHFLNFSRSIIFPPLSTDTYSIGEHKSCAAHLAWDFAYEP
jgi:hypothetical protein